jgi:hypothetical protein
MWPKGSATPCPGRRSEATGAWLELRRGTFTAAPADPPRREWCGMLLPASGQEETSALPPKPPPEHTTDDPWPLDIAAPAGAARLRLKAEAAGWDARIGYSRAWRDSVGAGNYVLHHHVRVQARREIAGQLHEVWAIWIAKVPPDGAKLAWKTDGGQINGLTAKVKQITEALTPIA